MLLSVVIPARNAGATLDAQLEALAAQTYTGAWEVVVADNGSTDDTAAVAARWSVRLPLTVVSANSRPGINHARNTGAGAARGDYLLFCDADDVVDRAWLQAMADAAPGCDALGGRLDRSTLNDEHAIAVRGGGTMGGLPVRAGVLPRPVGANCGVRTAVWRELGGFDEAYMRGGDETEFFWRLQLASYSLCYVPDAVIHYRVRGDNRGTARQFYWFGKQRVRLYRQFRGAGMPRSSGRQFVRRVGWLVVHLPDVIRSRSGRGVWMRRAASQCGRVVGSVQLRTLYL